MEDKEKLNELKEKIEEVYKDHRGVGVPRLETYIRYLDNEDIFKSARLRFFKNLMDYQFLRGKIKASQISEEVKE